jgi:hypothetical protein
MIAMNDISEIIEKNFIVKGTVNWSKKVANQQIISGQFFVNVEIDRETNKPVNVEIINE